MSWYLVETKGYYLAGAILVEAASERAAKGVAQDTLKAKAKGYNADHVAKAIEVTKVTALANMRTSHIITTGDY